jgi:hypothetical protein
VLVHQVRKLASLGNAGPNQPAWVVNAITRAPGEAVPADADLDYAVDAAAFAAFFHQGQICMNARKVLIERPLYATFVDRLAARAAALPVGDPAVAGRHRHLPHLASRQQAKGRELKVPSPSGDWWPPLS